MVVQCICEGKQVFMKMIFKLDTAVTIKKMLLTDQIMYVYIVI